MFAGFQDKLPILAAGVLLVVLIFIWIRAWTQRDFYETESERKEPPKSERDIPFAERNRPALRFDFHIMLPLFCAGVFFGTGCMQGSELPSVIVCSVGVLLVLLAQHLPKGKREVLRAMRPYGAIFLAGLAVGFAALLMERWGK